MESETSLPKQLFHYTSSGAVLGILRERCIWATMIHYMNDAQELQYALSLAREIVYAHTVNCAEGVNPSVLCEEFLDAIKNIAVFGFSLSEQNDLLSQWRAYCPSEGGYTIGFDTLQLKNISEANGFQLVRCEYNRDVQLAMLRPIVREMLDTAVKLPPQSRGLDLYGSFAAKLATVAASLKHWSFREEKEWRLISSPGRDRKSVKHRATETLIVPYCELPLVGDSQLPISSVVVGPNRHPELAGRALRSLATTMCGWPLRVEYSSSPFRHLR